MTDDLKASQRGLPTHLYRREIQANTDAEDSLVKLVNKIKPGSEVLDVGTGTGALGKFLREHRQCVVDGVTYNADEEAAAHQYYRDISIVDLERQPLPKALRSKTYDYVVCADVLEHLRNASEVLSDLRSLLKPSGAVLLSVPNVTHMGVLLGLLVGQFGRTHEGLLDETHVHFFDRKSLEALCTRSGLLVVERDAVYKNLLDTEFSRVDYQSLPAAVRAYLLCLPDIHIYQFIWSLRPLDQEPDQVPAAVDKGVPVLSPVVVEPRFSIQLYADSGEGFRESESVFAFGLQKPALQDLTFELRIRDATHRIRLDFGERPGAFELDGVRALDSDDQEVWSWYGERVSGVVLHECFLTGVEGRSGGRVIRCSGDDPWIAFNVDPESWLRVRKVVVRMSAPTVAADALFMHVDSMIDQLARAHSESSGRLSAQIDGLNGRLDSMRNQLQETLSSNQRLDSDLALARSQLGEMRASNSWRWTAWLRALASWMGKRSP
ncbi:MAG: class I SAM-dependent methyltransferase [Ramlibacter sp.]|nr:class I SAM-dependent methyltransferase [Ramlibacter sp.]